MSVVTEVKARLDLVQVVSERVPLQKAGRNFKALCPFHTERTPSFFVFPETQTWRCFGACGTGGDLFAFVMKAEGVEFSEALRRLARQTNVPLPEPRSRLQEESPALQVNRAAAEFYHQRLRSDRGQRAARYLVTRGVDQPTVERFQLGYAPAEGRALRDYLLALGFALEVVVQAGLVVEEGDRDLFRDRLVFPICDPQGRVAGFGGRVLDSGAAPKYLNTPRTPTFDKGGLLYGLHLADEAIRKAQEGVVVEGYMDVLAAHQHGFPNVVGSMGTALTERQAALARSCAPSFVVALDPDEAGQEATLRTLEAAWQAMTLSVHAAVRPWRGLAFYSRAHVTRLRVAVLPPGQDPDLVIQQSPGLWQQLVQEAVPFLDYLFQRAPARFPLQTAEGKTQAAEYLFPIIAAEVNPYLQDGYFRRLAALLGVSEATLEAATGRPSRPRGRPARREGKVPGEEEALTLALVRAGRDAVEERCLGLLLGSPELRQQAGALTPEHFHRSENRELFKLWIRCSRIEEIDQQCDPWLREHFHHLSQESVPLSDIRVKAEELAYCVRRLEERLLRSQQQVLLEALEPSWEDDEMMRRDVERLEGVNRRLKELFTSQRSREGR